MKKKILLIPLALLLALSLVAIGCPAPAPPVIDPYEEYVAGLQEGAFPVPREAFEQAMEEGILHIYDFAGWWPEEIYEGFVEEFGIEITRDHFASGDEIRAKFSLYPEAPYDLLLDASLSVLAFMRPAGATRQLNLDWLPNVVKYIPEEFAQMDSVAYGLIINDYIYNTKYVDDPRIPSWGVLFEPKEEFKGRITLWNDMYHTIGAALKYLGYNWFSDDEAELMEARDLLMELKPHIMVFNNWPKPLIMGDEAWIVGCWYGDGWFFREEYEAILPVLPTEGTRLGVGHSTHCRGSQNLAAAHLFLNYLNRPEVNALLIETIVYTPVNTAVLELLPEEVLAKVTLPEGYLDKTDQFDPRAATGKGLELRTAIWEELKR